jgi:hypothetical protein
MGHVYNVCACIRVLRTTPTRTRSVELKGCSTVLSNSKLEMNQGMGGSRVLSCVLTVYSVLMTYMYALSPDMQWKTHGFLRIYRNGVKCTSTWYSSCHPWKRHLDVERQICPIVSIIWTWDMKSCENQGGYGYGSFATIAVRSIDSLIIVLESRNQQIKKYVSLCICICLANIAWLTAWSCKAFAKLEPWPGFTPFGTRTTRNIKINHIVLTAFVL